MQDAKIATTQSDDWDFKGTECLKGTNTFIVEALQ